MKQNLFRTVALALFSTVLCGRTHSQTPNDDRHTNLSNPPANLPSETQVVGIVDEVNSHEIEVAQKAIEKSKNEEVLSFARQMIADHGEARLKLGEVGIQPAGSDIVNKMKEKHRAAGARLDKLEGTAFDRAYIAAMVDGHTAVLEKFDKKLIPAAKTGALTAYLRDTRQTIETHLEHARRIKTGLGVK
jgi:putative membrane protein